MSIIASNIKFLRKEKRITQSELAEKTGITRSNIGSYEEGRAIPKLAVLQKLADFFGISVDLLAGTDLEKKQISPEMPHIITIVTDSDNNERIVLVPDKASAGYTKGYADPEYIEKLPVFDLPFPEMDKNRTYRVFQIKGDSMLPVKSGSYIIGEYVSDYNDVTDGKTYIVVTLEDGIVFKRIYKQGKKLSLKSDNSDFSPYRISLEEVFELWKAVGYISFDFPVEGNTSLEILKNMIMDLKKEIHEIKRKL